MTYAVTVLAAALVLTLFLLVCALVGGSEQRDRLQAKVEHRDARIEDLENELRRRSRGNHPAGTGLLEDGRRLASQRDDLIAQGVNPADLVVPLAPLDTDNVVALREALEERDAGHEGGGGA